MQNQPSYKTSLLSQLVLIVVVSIVVMQLYKFYASGEILDLFNTLSSMVLGAYFQRSVAGKDTPKEDKVVEDPTVKKDTVEELGEMEELPSLVPNHLD